MLLQVTKNVLASQKNLWVNGINHDFNIGSGQCVVQHKAKNDNSLKILIFEPEEWQNHHLMVAPNASTCPQKNSNSM